ncbi:MAG: methyltransferase domain-containing protein [Chloroflexi bacterium]|nr:methyltransferase domain-containing protein [Chloroflexota bacterium]
MAADPRRALEKYRRHAATYDRAVARAEPLRHEAIARLQLQPGDIVLDLGCGTGLSFPLIEQAIGPEGRLIGIELSPDMLANAQERVERAGWQNATLIQAAAHDAEVPVEADTALFHFIHDIMRSPPALENVFRHVKPGGRVVAAGGKWAPWWALPLNLGFWYVARRYITTFEGYARPWSHLDRFVPDLRVESRPLGGVPGGAYIAWGRVPAAGPSENFPSGLP